MYTLFNDDWQFALKATGVKPEKSDFAPVDIPHDWLIYNTEDLYSTGDGWYKKTFSIGGISEQHIDLRFEGVYMDSEIYLNGDRIFEWKYGYTTFDVPLKGLRKGENEILIRVRFQSPNSRWYSGAGIFRNVWLRRTEEDRIAADGTYVVSYPEDSSRSLGTSAGSGRWRVEIDTEIECAAQGALKHTLLDADGNVAAVCETAFPKGTQKVSQSFTVNSPFLWETGKPYLYTLLTELSVNQKLADSRRERIGFRYCRFDAEKGFFLNGKHLKLHGACIHHDLGALGSAVNREATRRQLVKLLEMGVNAVRTSHNPPSVEFMELCDEMGILVDSEAFDMWEGKKTDYDYARFFPEWHERDVRSWIRRDRNHPCVIMWSIGNEIHDTNLPRGHEVTRELCRCVRIDDPKAFHPITIGSNYMRWQGAQDCAEELDLAGYNYAEDLYDGHHRQHPNWVIYGSETGSTVQSRGIYHFPAAVRTATFDDQQCSSLMNSATGWGARDLEYNILEDKKRAFSLGQFIWTGFDYIGEPTPYHTKNSYFGHIDTAGFPKDSFFAYKAEWCERAAPFVHLFPYWDWNEGQLIDLFAYSNCPKTEVFVNGRSLGVFEKDKTPDHLTGQWQTPYHKGEIRAVGYDEKGVKVCEHIRRSFGDPARIVLKPEKSAILANGEDMDFIEVSVEDADGNPVENARNRIHVSLRGPGRLMGLDNGDSTDFEQYKTASRKLFSGKLLIMLASKTVPGTVEVTVTSPGLPDAKLALEAIPAAARRGISCTSSISSDERNTEIPARKLELSVTGQLITPESPTACAHVRILPANSTRTLEEVSFKAVTDTGVETNHITIMAENGEALITPQGDGKYRLRAYLKNNGVEEIVSEIEMENEGFGAASIEPYSQIVLASLCSNVREYKSMMEGGVLTVEERSVRFDHVDFGRIGSDELTIGLCSFNEAVIPVDLVVDGDAVMTMPFQSKSEWSTYKYNTFRLPFTLRGEHSVAFVFHEELRFKGFRFSNPRRVGIPISALLCDEIYGDSFAVGDDAMEHIGNNVMLSFSAIDFGIGADAVEITGRTHNKTDNIHFKIGDTTQIFNFEKTDRMVTKRFAMEHFEGVKDLKILFLPGSDFDLKAVTFLMDKSAEGMPEYVQYH